jgi:ATP-binding cassette subfamily B protein
MQFLRKYINKYWRGFIAAVAFLTLEAMCDLMQPTVMSKIVDIGVANKQMDYVLRMGGLMLLITGVGAIAASSRNIISSKVSQKFGAEIRGDLFRKVQAFSFDNINKFEGASLVTRLTNDVTQMQNFVNGMMRILVKSPLLCIGSIIMAFRLNPKMALVLVIIVPIIIILIYINLRIGYPFFRRVQKSLDSVNSVMREYLSGVRVVKAFNRFDYEKNRFNRANSELGEISIKAMRVMAVFSPGITLTVNLGIVSVLWFGGFKVNNGEVHVGQIIAFINYMTQILNSLMMISFVFTNFVRAKASAERIGEVFAQEDTIITLDEATEPSIGNGSVEFKDVSFSYLEASGEPVLKGITFKSVAGETIGIIGSTGSGKSSLVNLIPRFYDATTGSIEVNGVNVRNIEPELLRESIAIVPQKTVLFSGSILDNIKWGKADADMDEVKKAACVAQADEFISSFPEGYNTMLGQGGVNLSGGQKQRISIARALIKKPEIIILDDCTSAVDMSTEGKIREALRSFSNNLTCFIIAQRITSVMETDKIIVLNDGKIVGMGKHVELMKACEIYREIYHSQLGKEAE